MTSKHPQRLFFLDLLKTCALVIMFYDHTLKILLPPSIYSSLPVEIFLDRYAPIASALFLSVAGYNLALSFNRQKIFSVWLKRKLVYVAWLILLSYSLAAVVSFEDIHWLASGILQTIGVCVLLGIGLLNTLKPGFQRVLVYSLIILGTLIASQSLLSLQIYIPFITSYSFPLLPFFSYFTLGMLLFQLQSINVILKTNQQLISLAFLVATGLVLSPFSHIWVIQGYWIPNAVLNMWLLLALTWLFLWLSKQEQVIRAGKFLALPGKNTLVLYVGHLTLLGVVSLVYRIQNQYEFWLVFLGLIGLMYLYSWINWRLIINKFTSFLAK